MVNVVAQESSVTLAQSIINFLKEAGFWCQVSLIVGNKKISAGPLQTEIVEELENGAEADTIVMNVEGPLYRAIHDYFYDKLETYIELTRIIENSGYNMQWEHSWSVTLQKAS